MPTINQLSQIQTLSGADQVPVYSATNGDARKASLSSILAYVEANFVSPQFVTQYASPNVNGTNVAVASTSAPTWLVLTPTASFASMTITLPAAAQLADGLELLVFTSQSVGTLSVLANGALSVVGAPSSLTANSSFLLRFNALTQGWYIASGGASGGAIAPVGTFTPVYHGVGLVGTVTFTGRYQIVGGAVTLEFGIVVGAGSSLTFTYGGGEYFDGMPAGITPTDNMLAGTPVGDGADMFAFHQVGVFRLVFNKVGSPSLTFSAGDDARFAVTYLL